MKYKVVLRQSAEGFSVSCPGLPGCWSQGKTEEEALANIREAIREYLEARDVAVKDEESREVEVLSEAKPAPRLEDLLEDISETNLYRHVDAGPAQGNEAW